STPPRALITGGAGFIGCHLARRLLAGGHRVALLDDFSRGVHDGELRELTSRPEVRLIECNLLDPTATAELARAEADRFEVIVHLAAIIGVANVLDRPYAVLRDNVAMLAHVVELGRRQAGLQRLLFASTSEVYAGTLRHFHLPVPTPEASPLALTDLEHPRTSYMLSKIYGEAMCHQAGL